MPARHTLPQSTIDQAAGSGHPPAQWTIRGFKWTIRGSKWTIRGFEWTIYYEHSWNIVIYVSVPSFNFAHHVEQGNLCDPVYNKASGTGCACAKVVSINRNQHVRIAADEPQTLLKAPQRAGDATQ
eukprot:8012178-Pyramimonas_sp.AAC.1